MNDIPISKDEENFRETNLREDKENTNNHKIDDEEEPIKEKEYIENCEKCGVHLFTEAQTLDFETRESFKCGYRVLRINGKIHCPSCAIKFFWDMDKQNLTLKEGFMEDKQELILKEQGQELAKILTPDTIKKYICPNATTQEIFMFLQIAKMYQLNPFKREIYLVKYEGYSAQNIVGYETYLKRAERTGVWNGMKVWTEGEVPQLTAKIEIYRKGWDKPFSHEVDYSEYVQKKKDGTITKFWKEKPKTMLKKVVVSQAFRMCFPDEFGGMPYTMEEMPIDIEKLPTEEIKPIENGLSSIPEKVIEETLEKEKVKSDEVLKDNIKPPSCEKCGEKLTPKVFNFSMEKYNEALCFNCQRNKS